jgi:hypothetical protein
MVFFSVIMTFTYKAILNEIFCNLLLKIFIVFLMHQNFYAYFFQMIMILLQV